MGWFCICLIACGQRSKVSPVQTCVYRLTMETRVSYAIEQEEEREKKEEGYESFACLSATPSTKQQNNGVVSRQMKSYQVTHRQQKEERDGGKRKMTEGHLLFIYQKLTSHAQCQIYCVGPSQEDLPRVISLHIYGKVIFFVITYTEKLGQNTKTVIDPFPQLQIINVTGVKIRL